MGRNYSSGVARLKSALEETHEQMDVVKRENKNLADEIRDLLDQLGDGEDQSMILTNKEEDLKLRKRNCNQLLRRLKGHLSQKRTRFLELSWSCLNSNRKLTEKLQ